MIQQILLSSSDVKQYIIYGPTILFGIFVLWGFIWGFLRGFRKTFLYTIVLIISFAICFYILIECKKTFYNDINSGNIIQALQTIPKLQEVSFDGVNSIEGIASQLIKHFVNFGDFGAIIPFAIVLLDAIVSLVLFVFLYIIIRPIVSFILRMIVCLFFGNRKIKRRLREEYEDCLYNGYQVDPKEFKFKRRRLLGGLMGAVKGSISGFVLFILIGGLYSIASGGSYITLNEANASTQEYVFNKQDFTDYINAVRTYEEVGIGKILSYIKVDGQNANEMLFDKIISAKYKHGDQETIIKLRKELQNITKIYYKGIDLGVNFKELETYNVEFLDYTMRTLIDSEMITSVIPLAVDFLYNNITKENAENLYVTIGKFLSLNILENKNVDYVQELTYMLDTIVAITDLGINPIALLKQGSSGFTNVLSRIATAPIEKKQAVLDCISNSVIMSDVIVNGLKYMVNIQSGISNHITIEDFNSINWFTLNKDGTLTKGELSYTLDVLLVALEIVDLNNLNDYQGMVDNIVSPNFTDDKIEKIANCTLVAKLFKSVIQSIPLGTFSVVMPNDVSLASSLDGDGQSKKDGELYLLVQALRTITNSMDTFDIKNINVSTFLNLGKDSLEVILNSNILHQTISSGLLSSIDKNEELAKFMVIPESVYVNNTQPQSYMNLSQSEFGEKKIIKSEELINLFLGLKILLSDENIAFDNINKESIDISNIFEENARNTVSTSRILMASLTKSLEENESISVPNSCLEEDGVQNVITKLEFHNLIIGLELLGITKLGDSVSDITSINVAINHYDVLLQSMIISRKLAIALNDNTLLIKTSITNRDEFGYISVDEMNSLFFALKELGISDVDNVDNISSTDLSDNLDNIVESDLLHATISDVIIDKVGSVDVPTICYEVVEHNLEDNVLTKDELEKILNGLKLISPNGIEATVDINLVTVNTIAVLIESTILRVQVSKSLLNFNTLIIPMNVLETTIHNEIIEKDELNNLLNPLGGETIIGTISFAVNDIMDNIDDMVESVILHATISDRILSVSDLTIPDITLEYNKIVIYNQVGEVNIITKYEIKSLINALKILGISDYASVVTDGVDISIFNENSNTILDSLIMHATISKTIEKTLPGYITFASFGYDVIAEGAINDTEIISFSTELDSFNISTLNESTLTTFVEEIKILNPLTDIEKIRQAIDVSDILHTMIGIELDLHIPKGETVELINGNTVGRYTKEQFGVI